MIGLAFVSLLFSLAAPIHLPFSVDATEDASANFPGAPQVESASFAQWQGRWVFIGGRMAGYHALGGGSADFPRADANREVWVVDTTVKPARTYHVPVAQLPAKFDYVKDEWQSTGQLYYQDGSSLYIAGGYGQDSNGRWVTYSVISKIDLPAFIQGVVRGKLVAESIKFAMTPLVQSAGGDLVKLSDNYLYLVMGHVFTGSYTAFEGQGKHNSLPVSQVYLNEIRKLSIVPNSDGALSVQLAAKFRDENEFHRRDLNVAKILTPKGLGLAAYGGVFTPDTQLNFSKPVYLLAGGQPVVDSGFEQKMNSYHCAKVLIYDRTGKTMYTTFFGGISRFFWDLDSKQFIENVKSGSQKEGNYLDGLQWSDQVSTIRRLASGETDETVQPQSLPAFVGTDALFIPFESPGRAAVGTDILDLASLRGKRTWVGYIYGGIRAFPRRFPYNKGAAPYNSGTVPTRPNDLVLKVYVEAEKVATE